MNHFILKHYYFNFVCDFKWHKINVLDGAFCIKPWRRIFVSAVGGTIKTVFKREE